MNEKEEELIKLLIAIRDSFTTIVESINRYIESLAPPEVKPAPAPTMQPTPVAPKFDPASLFPEDLRQLLTFEETKEGWKITPRQYLGAENFAKIAQIVRENGGSYLSAGKKSHFLIPKR